MLSGLDCDDTDPWIHPGALERVGNRRDDNCFGGDLTSVPAPRPLALHRGKEKRSVVLITIDTVQQAMLAEGPLGGQRHMPNLARFAASSLHFTRHYAAAPYTNDALGALMTGEYPMNFIESGVVLGANPTIAELLQSIGYRTATVNQASKGGNWFVYRGFSELDIELGDRHAGYRAVTSPETTKKALAAIERLHASGTPFFFWVHYMDPHYEYMPHDDTPFSGGSVEDLYHQEVYATDRALAPLLRWLEHSGFLERGIVAITPDHGEMLAGAEARGHAWHMDESVLRTFLVLRARELPARVLRTRIRAIDLYPTLLDLAAGIQAQTSGAHLAPVIRGDETRHRDAFARSQYRGWSTRVAYVDRWKLVENLRTGRRALYDLHGHGEAVDLAPEQPAIAKRIHHLMGRTWDQSMNDEVLRRRRLPMSR